MINIDDIKKKNIDKLNNNEHNNENNNDIYENYKQYQM